MLKFLMSTALAMILTGSAEGWAAPESIREQPEIFPVATQARTSGWIKPDKVLRPIVEQALRNAGAGPADWSMMDVLKFDLGDGTEQIAVRTNAGGSQTVRILQFIRSEKSWIAGPPYCGTLDLRFLPERLRVEKLSYAVNIDNQPWSIRKSTGQLYPLQAQVYSDEGSRAPNKDEQDILSNFHTEDVLRNIYWQAALVNKGFRIVPAESYKIAFFDISGPESHGYAIMNDKNVLFAGTTRSIIYFQIHNISDPQVWSVSAKGLVRFDMVIDTENGLSDEITSAFARRKPESQE